ncbi:hypothetical protein HYZ76_02395 [Candidatus Falkowbacteria bacterium]|nr:hypothetical protein [Candidatus Falkowbacteria bacterium]
MKKIIKDGLEKSSRSKADLFELLIARSLANHYGIDNNFGKSINTLKKKIIFGFGDGLIRVIEQEEKSRKVTNNIINFLIREKVPSIKNVKWIGRNHQKEATLSDVDLVLDNGKIIGISLKSTRLGSGTQKNLGYKTLKKYLSLDIDEELEIMWKNIKLELEKKGGHLKSLSNGSKTAIKNKKRSHPIIEKVGKKYGNPVQIRSVALSVNNFNTLDEKNKKDFMKVLFGLKEDNRRIFNVLAQSNKISIYWNEIYNSVVTGKNLQAKKVRDISYGIYTKDKLLIRLQASFTNGIGLSAYCQRAFLP